MVEVSTYCDKEKLIRLQNYTKNIAPSLRFSYTNYYSRLNEYNVHFSVLVEEYNKINDIEYKIEEENKLAEERKRKEEWNKLNIFQKVIKWLKD